MYIREVLSFKDKTGTISIAPDAPIAEAVRQLVEFDIGSLVVMRGDTLVGFITERDILRGMHARSCNIEGVRVADLMEQEPVIASSDDSVDYARDVLTKSRTSHLIVLDGDKATGVLSFHDVAKACLKEAKFENSLLKRYIKHWPE
jgi:CBS domain-containing protein